MMGAWAVGVGFLASRWSGAAPLADAALARLNTDVSPLNWAIFGGSHEALVRQLEALDGTLRQSVAGIKPTVTSHELMNWANSLKTELQAFYDLKRQGLPTEAQDLACRRLACTIDYADAFQNQSKLHFSDNLNALNQGRQPNFGGWIYEQVASLLELTAQAALDNHACRSSVLHHLGVRSCTVADSPLRWDAIFGANQRVLTLRSETHKHSPTNSMAH